MSTNKNYIKVISEEPNIRYTFIPSPIDITLISKTSLIQSNDIFTKYEVNANISGELIICSDSNKLNKFNYKIIQETYSEYLEIKSKRDPKKDIWINNIIDGKSEQEDIFYRDEDFILIPNYTWDKKNLDQIHVLGILTDKTINTIRDLTFTHVKSLKKIKDIGLEKIESKYFIDKSSIKMFIHYTPSAFQLHIHFTNTNNNSIDSSVEYSHELSQVIFNLELISDYYKKFDMCKRI